MRWRALFAVDDVALEQRQPAFEAVAQACQGRVRIGSGQAGQRRAHGGQALGVGDEVLKASSAWAKPTSSLDTAM